MIGAAGEFNGFVGNAVEGKVDNFGSKLTTTGAGVQDSRTGCAVLQTGDINNGVIVEFVDEDVVFLAISEGNNVVGRLWFLKIGNGLTSKIIGIIRFLIRTQIFPA
jgi:hypothetical protein